MSRLTKTNIAASLSPLQRRKRLGQFFSGPRVSQLLAALCDVENATSVLDPMAGSGDLLAACAPALRHGMPLWGIDVDPVIAETCAKNVPRASVIGGSAFDADSLRALPQIAWSRVLTNPPYVRYQSLAKSGEESAIVPSAIEVRTHLIEALGACEALDDDDKALFRTLAARYSGLSDLAVPSVILCAALTAQDGVLGLVMPEAWLTRDYAIPVHYLLARWFQIEAVVEDAHAAWFDNALVRTTLVVARRVQRRTSTLAEMAHSGYPHVRLSGAASDATSLVARRYKGLERPERAFAEDVTRWRANQAQDAGDYVDIHWVNPNLQVRKVANALARQPWLECLEATSKPPTTISSRAEPRLSVELAAWLDDVGASHAFAKLEDFGVLTGQGLRTGANEFFYANKIKETGGKTLLGPLPLLSGRSIWVDSTFVLPALRRQTELPEGCMLRASNASSLVLNLAGAALPEDRTGETKSERAKQLIDPSLAELVRAAAEANFGTEDVPRRVWELSAVAPNCVRTGEPGASPRMWYQLPRFTDRHRPHIAIPRVNNQTPRAYFNNERAMLVDANFSGLWLGSGAALDEFALLSLLNSTWMQAAMELSASLLGGGAAKLEASHLRLLPVPHGLITVADKLSTLGKGLTIEPPLHQHALRREIDRAILSLFGGRAGQQASWSDLTSIGVQARERRSTSKWRKARQDANTG